VFAILARQYQYDARAGLALQYVKRQSTMLNQPTAFPMSANKQVM
jgi:hypothetical protein